MDKKVEILLFEDNPGDVGLIEEILEELADFPYELKTVETLSEGLNLLKERPFDVILSDLGLPDSNGIDTFLGIYLRNSQIPIIILTGINDEKIGIDAVKKGAQDYLVKGQVEGRLLNRSIRYSIERKKAEEELKKSEERYRIVTEQTGQLIYDFDIMEDKINWAGAIEEITGFKAEEFKDMKTDSWLEKIHPDDIKPVLERIHSCLEKGGKLNHEFRFRRKDGKYIYIEERGVCLVNDVGSPYRVLGIMNDITEKKEAEKFLAKIEEFRKKEIHHRIKNNLQVVSSLLDLQADKFTENEICNTSKVLKAFRDSQNRVVSMALIHEELYESRDVNTLNFAAYLEKLTTNLFRCYNVESSGIHLALEIEEQIFLGMDTVVPLGIVINELVSNSLKYAFPNRNKGEVRIKLCREESQELSQEFKDNTTGNNNQYLKSTNFILIVSDNGVGVPESLDLKKPGSLGIELVTTLVDQLEGKLELKRKNGTEFTIRFTVTEK
jgi:PAS domain S-box-containing protein